MHKPTFKKNSKCRDSGTCENEEERWMLRVKSLNQDGDRRSIETGVTKTKNYEKEVLMEIH